MNDRKRPPRASAGRGPASSSIAVEHSELLRLRVIVERHPECVKVLDARGRLLQMNPAGLRMIEADAENAPFGQCVYGLVVPEHRAAFRDLTERVCRGERGILEFEIVGFKGTRRWLETHAAPFRDELSGETYLVGVTRDVTDRKRAEAALRESEQRFQRFMDNSPAVAWIKDSRLRYSYFSNPYQSILGIDPQAALGKDDFQVWPQAIAREFRGNDEQVLARGAPLQTVEHAPGRTGEGRHWLVVKFPLPDESGAAGVGGMAIDVTERVAAEAKARHYAARIRKLLDRLHSVQEGERRRIAIELHDGLGQNLTALGIGLNIIRHLVRVEPGDELDERLSDLTRVLEETVDDLRRLVRELRPPVLEELGLVPALHWYAGRHNEIGGPRVSVQGRELEPRLPQASEIALFRIVQEALSNAAKHSGASRVLVTIDCRDGFVELSIEDDGRGSPAAALEEGSTHHGLGITGMRERAEAVGGTLRVESSAAGLRVIARVPHASADPGHPG